MHPDGLLDPVEAAEGAADAPAAPESAPDSIEPLGPSYAPTEDGGEVESSPYYVREWRGAPLFDCPGGDFHGRSHEAVESHIQKAHAPIPEPDMKTRAARAGIILGK
jgi:hypothetical protein